MHTITVSSPVLLLSSFTPLIPGPSVATHCLLGHKKVLVDRAVVSGRFWPGSEVPDYIRGWEGTLTPSDLQLFWHDLL